MILASFCVCGTVLSGCYRRATRVNIGTRWLQLLSAFTDHAHISWTKLFINRREHVAHDSVYTMPRVGRDRLRTTYIRPSLFSVFCGATTTIFVIAFSWHIDLTHVTFPVCLRYDIRLSVQTKKRDRCLNSTTFSPTEANDRFW